MHVFAISSLVLPWTFPARWLRALVHRGGASSQPSFHAHLHLPLPHSWAHTGFALWAHPHITSLMTNQSQALGCAAATSPEFGFDFSCKQDAFLSQAGRDGTRYCDYPLRKKIFLFFISFLPVTGFRSGFQSKEIFKSQVLQEGWNSSL